ncbi:MAG: hypothetical protein KC609_23225 [Myxococcales bacterium]|nr:hypothetical protein [Myxococcales bacterium]
MSQVDTFVLASQFSEVGIYFHFADLLLNLIDLSDGPFKEEVQQQVDRLSHRRPAVKIQLEELCTALAEVGLGAPEAPRTPAQYYEFSQAFIPALLEGLPEGGREWIGALCGVRYGQLMLQLQIMTLIYRLLMIEPNHGLLRKQLQQILGQMPVLREGLLEVLRHPELHPELTSNLSDGISAIDQLAVDLVLPSDTAQAKQIGIHIQTQLNELVAAKTAGLMLLQRDESRQSGE